MEAPKYSIYLVFLKKQARERTTVQRAMFFFTLTQKYSLYEEWLDMAKDSTALGKGCRSPCPWLHQLWAALCVPRSCWDGVRGAVSTWNGWCCMVGRATMTHHYSGKWRLWAWRALVWEFSPHWPEKEVRRRKGNNKREWERIRRGNARGKWCRKWPWAEECLVPYVDDTGRTGLLLMWEITKQKKTSYPESRGSIRND